MDMEKKETGRAEYNLSALAEAILLAEDGLPGNLAEDLQTLRQMLEDAVKGEEGTETPKPLPPAYGKTALPESNRVEAGVTMVLRRDRAESFPENLTALSPRRTGEYVIVPQVVGQGGDT